MSWKTENPEKRRAQVARRMKRMRAWFRQLKSKLECACGEKDPVCIDFHHLNPNEKKDINALIRNGTIERVKEEVAKCAPICANCHRKGHAGRPQPFHTNLFPQ